MGFLSKIGKSISGSSKGMSDNISSSSNNVIRGLSSQLSENLSGKALSNLGSNITSGIFNKTLSSLKDGIVQGMTNGISNKDATPGLVSGESGSFYGQDYFNTLGVSGYSTFVDFYTSDYKIKSNSEDNTKAYNKNEFKGLILDEKKQRKDANSDKTADIELTQSTNWHQTLELPDWGYDAFINERAIWQKGLTSPFGEPGYFYFKIFFKFNTQFGLLGGILNDDDPVFGGHNTAMKYLHYLHGQDEQHSGTGYFKSLVPDERMRALTKFVKSLSYINCNAPWFFKAVKGLDKAGNPITNEFSKEKSIEIECNIDAIDMRLTTLLDLYRFVCYDDFSNKEVIPENLRKFDMTILIFNTPIKTLHTAIKQNGNVYGYKQASAHNNLNNKLMSFKLFEFNGCEIDYNTIGSMIPGDMNNDTPFQLGKGSIKINYDRCNTYMSNETNGILFGSTGFYFDYDYLNSFEEQEKYTRKNAYLQKYDGVKNNFVDIAEEYTKNNLMRISGYSLGNLYGESNAPSYPPDGTRVSGQPTEYFKSKIAHLHNRRNAIANIGGNLLANMLSSSMDMNATLGYLEGYKERGPGSEWWKYKLDKLTSNFNHLWTTSPYGHKNGPYNTSAYVQNQNLNDSLSGIDQGNSIYSYMLKDKMKSSMQNLRNRSNNGEFVGPGSSAFNSKISALKNGSHTYTDTPYVRTSKSKTVNVVKENTVYGETNLLYNPTHTYTQQPYNRSYNINKLKLNVDTTN